MPDAETGQMKLAVFFMGLGHHVAGWRHSGGDATMIHDLARYCEVARRAEDAKIDLIFIGDNLSVRETNPEALKHVADYIVQFEPITLLSALSAVTSRIGLVATASTSYTHPFHIARMFASLDHLSGGRAGVNVVTSISDLEAQNFGRDVHYEHGDRYERAMEYADVLFRLWDSWEDDAFIRDPAAGIYVDPAKQHVANFKGKHFNVKGPLNIMRPPQGYPVIAQAGASEDGRTLASQTADIIYSIQQSMESGQAFYKDMNERAAKAGRKPGDLKILPGVMPVVAETEAEAKRKFQEMQDLVEPAVGLSYLSLVLGGVDLSGHPLDGPLPEIELTNASQTRQAAVLEMARKENLTLRQLYLRIAGGRVHWVFVGSAEQLADELERRFLAKAADGYAVMPATIPGGIDDFCSMVVPILRERGVFRSEYEGSTLRENLGLRFADHGSRRVGAG